MKYYIASNAAEPKAGIQFERIENLGGTIWGVYATEKAEEIEKLDALVGKSSVNEITAAEYQAMLKKKQGGLEGSHVLKLPQPVTPPVAGASIKQPTAVVVEGAADERPVEIAKELETPEDALKVGDATEAHESGHKKHGKKSH